MEDDERYLEDQWRELDIELKKQLIEYIKAPEKEIEVGDIDEEEMTLEELANLLRKRVQKDWDLVICVSGEEGVGKSTFAIKGSKKVDTNFVMQKNVIVSPTKENVINAVKTFPKYSGVTLDEAVKTMYKLNWQSDESKMLNVVFNLSRRFNHIFFLCFPRFTDLNEYFRNHRVKLWIHVVARGLAVVFFPDTVDIFRSDPYHLDECSKLMRRATARKKVYKFTPEQKIAAWRKLPIFMGFIRFSDLDPEDKKQYLAMKETVDVADSEASKEDIWYKLKELNADLKEEGLNQKERAKKLRVHYNTIYRWDKERKNP